MPDASRSMWHRHSCLCSWGCLFLICHPDRSGRLFLAHHSLVRRPRSGETVAISKPTSRLVQSNCSSQRPLRLLELCVISFFSFVFRFSKFQFLFSNLTPALRHPPPAPPESFPPVWLPRARCTTVPRAIPQSSTAPTPPPLPYPISTESDPPAAAALPPR